jgi:hypothetical protein
MLDKTVGQSQVKRRTFERALYRWGDNIKWVLDIRIVVVVECGLD